MFDQLRESCRQAESFPVNSLRKQAPTQVLVAQRDQLQSDEARLFHSSIDHVYMREEPVGENKINDHLWKDLPSLIQHLDSHLKSKKKDPRSRHVFIPAGSSRSHFYCTASMFKYICSYHQVSPGFLKLVHSLGEQIQHGKTFHSVGYFDEFLPKESPGRAFGMPELGRSGSEFRNYYQLQAMEYSSESDHKWVMRQTTVFHSFDLDSARCFWITIKANNDIKKRVTESSKSLDELRDSSDTDLSASFKASLLTHLLHLEWCTEGWRWSIDDREARLRGVLVRAEAAPIKRDDTRQLVRLLSFPQANKEELETSLTPSESNNCLCLSPLRNTAVKGGAVNGILGARAHTTRTARQEAEAAAEQCKIQAMKVMRHEGILEEFSVTEFQALTSGTLSLEEAKLAMTLNIDILRGIKDSYKYLLESEQCPPEIQTTCKKAVTHFIRRVDSLERELSIECRRAETLISQLQEIKPLYDSLLQFRNTEMNKLMAFNAQYSSLRMESLSESAHDIAKRTERDTASMHIITLFTLLLLPGTFLGSFFSTEIVKGDGNGFSINSKLGILFAEICAPMMGFTMLVWGLYMWFKRRSAERNRWRELEGGYAV